MSAMESQAICRAELLTRMSRPRAGARNEPTAKGRIAQIAGKGEGLESCRGDQANYFAGVRLVRKIIGRRVGAFASVSDRSGAAWDQDLAPPPGA